MRVEVLRLQASDCGWLYFDSHLLEPILASILKSPQDAHQLSYILAAFLDAHALLQHAPTPAEQADSSSLAKVWISLQSSQCMKDSSVLRTWSQGMMAKQGCIVILA